MLPFKHLKNNNFQTGFAPIWIILLIFLIGGIFVIGRGNLLSRSVPVLSPSPSSSTASSESAKVKSQSLYDLCKSEIQTLPKLPFVYESVITTGSNADLYRKDRIKDKKSFSDYATCGLMYSTIKVIEQTYASLGLEYYEYSKADPSTRWGSYTSLKQLPQKIDNIYGAILQKQGWIRQTKEGGEILGYGLPTLIYYKDMGDKDYYIDVVVGPTPASLYLMIVKK
ncbi:MAG: hypothetical protein Q7R97_01250 [Candidatus Daviesbacteria bacterium]|nr:hypothetical protein [Candidatus Daviesbacteria bacterium]